MCLGDPEDCPLEDPEDCPVDLVTWLCLPEEDLPEEEDPCDPPNPFDHQDTTTWAPFPTVPDADAAAQLCRFAENKLAIAKSTGEILSSSTLTGFLRMFHALAFRPNPPTGLPYKHCTLNAAILLDDYWGFGLVPPPLPIEDKTLQDLIDRLRDFMRDTQDDYNELTHNADTHLADFEFFGLTEAEAAPWLAALNAARDAADRLRDATAYTELDDIIRTLTNILIRSKPDENRPTPPGLELPGPNPTINNKIKADAVATYVAYIQDKQARGLQLQPHETEYLTEHFKGEEPQ